MSAQSSLAAAVVLLAAVSRGVAATPPPHAAQHNENNGTFELSIQLIHAGTQTFSSPDGNSYTLNANVSIGNLKLSELVKAVIVNGKVTSVSVTATPGGSALLVVNGKTAKVVMHGAVNTAKVIPWSANTSLFGNFMPSLATQLVQQANLKVNGTVPVNALILDSITPVKGTLKRSADMVFRVNQQEIKLHHFVLTMAGALGNVDLDLYCNSANKVLIWNVPSQQYVAVLKGEEALAAAVLKVNVHALASPTSLRVLSHVQIPMRDGVKLAATVTLPQAPGRYPVILERTPYGRTMSLDGGQFAAHGYAVVIQDVRGRYGSRGKWLPFMNEANDGEDTVKWCADQPWSNGKVGMFGASYGGYVQWSAAQHHVGALKCIIPVVSPPNPLMNIPYEQGELALENDVWWSAIADGRTNGSIKTFTTIKPFYVLPLNSVPKAVLGRTSPIIQWWLTHPPSSPVWQAADFNAAMPQMGSLPALMVSGWFDGDGIGTDINFHDMVAAGHLNQHVIFGPWTHAVGSSTKFQGRDFGQASVLPLQQIYLNWLDHWLKGDNNGAQNMPKVQAFIMGINKWMDFSSWPPHRAQLQHWNFHTAFKNGIATTRISTLQPSNSARTARYTYDPAHPVTDEGILSRGSNPVKIAGNDDLLRFESKPLARKLVVAGPLTLRLWASSSARDTDWIAVLEDLPPKGPPFYLARGIVRARYRNGFTNPSALTPGKPVKYFINLWATGNAFLPGHRIVVIVTSSLFPDFARNMNTMANPATTRRMAIAHQQIYCDAGHCSSIVLPVIPAGPNN